MNGPVQVLDLAQCGFRAMGTDVEVLVLDGEDDDLHWAHAEVDRLEALWSRFRDDSEVARLNRHAGDWVDVAPETTEVLRAAIQAWKDTDGAFDPLLGSELAALGYDHSFEQVDVTGAGATCPPSTPVPRHEGDLQVDRARRRARVVPGRSLDLGGIAKGWTADWLVAGVLERGAAGACANLGGDVAVAGRAPQTDGWYVAVDHHVASTAPATLAVRHGGVATSTTLRKRWCGPGGDVRHHLVDPRRGTACLEAIAAVTVVASSAARGEILTKVAFITPEQLGRALGPGEGALLTTADGRRESIGDLVVVHPVEGIVPDAG